MANALVEQLINQHRAATDRPLRREPPEAGVAQVVDRDHDGRVTLATPNGGQVTAARDFNAAAIPGATLPITASGQRTIASSVNHCACHPTPQIPPDEDLPLLDEVIIIYFLAD